MQMRSCLGILSEERAINKRGSGQGMFDICPWLPVSHGVASKLHDLCFLIFFFVLGIFF
jgi:hypothetical protein